MRTFPLGDILSVTTGLLVAPRGIEALYELLDYMTGDQLFTHQLPRASRECKPELLRQHPALAEVVVPDNFDGEEHIWRWLAEQMDRYGDELLVAPLPAVDHTYVDPIAELRMLKPDGQIIPVVVADGEDSS